MATPVTVADKLRRTADEHATDLEPHESDTLKQIAHDVEERTSGTSAAGEGSGENGEEDTEVRKAELLVKADELRERDRRGESLSKAERDLLKAGNELAHEHAMSASAGYRGSSGRRARARSERMEQVGHLVA